ncbi:MAG: YggT family protein [Rhodoferax sp.]
MLYQIVALLLEVSCGLVAGACLLRLYMQWLRVPMSARSGNPLGRFVFALTDWIVLPLRRALPALGGVDSASLVAAWAMQVLEFFLLWLLGGMAAGAVAVPVLALFGVARLALAGLSAAVIVYALLSWLANPSPLADVVERLVAPPLAPIRRVVPLVGGVDLSPLALLVVLQVASIVLGHLQSAVLLGL